MRKILSFLCMLFISVMVLGLLPVKNEIAIYDNVIRLHVLANSDSKEDQELKMKVRDAVLFKTQSLIKDCKTYEKAYEILNRKSSLSAIEKAADAEISANGYDYKAEVSLGKEKYGERTYTNMCFPSGIYTSLQVKIGKARGKNFWCVLFPTLCLSVATKENEDAFIDAGFTEDQYKVITESKGEYEIKFKLLELLQGIKKSK